MTFTVKIALQPFEVAFEAGSIAEAVAILTEPDNELSKLAALANGTATDDGDGSEEPAGDAPVAEKPAPAKRGRKAKAAVEAVAPPPMPVPDAPPMSVTAPAPVDAGPIPPFLDRTTGAATPTLAPPPPAPAPAPAAPAPAAPPPVGVLAPKVIAELKAKLAANPGTEKEWVLWLASAGLVVPSATWDEAMLCIQFLDDAKLGPVAAGLQISG
ncbi:hypothetical protein ACWX0K_15230 [Nitrobacteraceae bacterium UC4446_H13]